MCELVSRERDSATSFFLHIHEKGERFEGVNYFIEYKKEIFKTHLRPHLYTGINVRYETYQNTSR